jgi:thioredoxin domain-containing protein 5
MQGKVTIAEVNCEEHDALCKSQDVKGYPTLAYYSEGGVKSEYSGGRKLDQLKAFAEKASAP